jgi:hypothetical protein
MGIRKEETGEMETRNRKEKKKAMQSHAMHPQP